MRTKLLLKKIIFLFVFWVAIVFVHAQDTKIVVPPAQQSQRDVSLSKANYTPNVPVGASTVMLINQPYDRHNTDNIFYVLIGLSFIFIIAKKMFSEFFVMLFQLSLQPPVLWRITTRNATFRWLAPRIVTSLLSVAVVGLYVAHIITHYYVAGDYLVIAGAVAGIVWTFLIIKHIVLNFLCWMFNIDAQLKNLYFLIFSCYDGVLGILLIPIVALMVYAPSWLSQIFFFTSVIIIAGVFIYVYTIILYALRRQRVIYFSHFLLYICGLEVLPILLLLKMSSRIF